MEKLKRVLLALIFFALATPALATDYYFSDCFYSPLDSSTSGYRSGSFCDQAAADSAFGSVCKTCYGTFPNVYCLDRADCVLGAVTNPCDFAPAPGSIDNPFCLDPGGDQVPSSFAHLSDGGTGALTTELAAGDNVYVCAGRCDGRGSATYYLAKSIKYSMDYNNGVLCNNRTADVFLSPRVSGGGSGTPITIKPYCNGNGCETVTLSPDTNANGQYDAGEPTVFIANGGDGKPVGQPGGDGLDGLPDLAWWTIDGDPMNTGTRYLKFDRWGGGTGAAVIMMDCTDPGGGDGNNSDGPNDFSILNTEWNHIGAASWPTDVIGGPSGACHENQNTGEWPGGGYWFKLNDAGGPITARGNLIQNACAMITRWNNNPDAAAVLTFDNNRVINVYTVSNDHDFNGPFPSQSTYNYTNNYVEDMVGGFSGENNVRNWNVVGNTIFCTGARPMKYGDRCETAISVNDGDTPMCGHCYDGNSSNNSGNPDCVDDTPCTGLGMTCPVCYADNINISKNTVAYLKQGTNKMQGAIRFEASRGAGAFTSAKIENNIVYGVEHKYQLNDETGTAIYVNSRSAGLMVRNNTLYFNQQGLVVIQPAITIESNIFARSNSSTGGNKPELVLRSGAAASTVRNNDLYDWGEGGTVATVNASNWTCGQIAANLGTNNVCLPTSFKLCDASSPRCATTSSVRKDWNLRLATGIQASVDTGFSGGSPATEDIDSEPRPYGPVNDMGADEFWPTGLAPFDLSPAARKPAGVQ